MQPVDFEIEVDIKDIVIRIDFRDIKRYVERKYFGQLDIIDTHNRIQYEINELENILQSKGYIIDRVNYIDTKDKKTEELEKEVKKLRHEVSVLAKKLNDIKEDKMKYYYVYVIECEDGSFYTGYTTDVGKRFAAHKAGKGAKYTRSHKPVQVVFSCKYSTRSEAMKAECAIKKLSHQQKFQMVLNSEDNK